MPDLTHRLDVFPALSPDERAALAREVAASGDAALTAALAEAEAFAALLDAAAAPPDLAQHLADERLGHATDPALAARIARDPALRAEAERIGTRLDALAAASEDPVAQFERLSGHTLKVARVERPRAADRPAAPASRSARVSRLRLVRGLAVAAAVCIAAYAGLSAVSGARLSEPARVADLDAALDYRTPTLRGGADPGAPLADAIDGLAEARHTTLGLFPRYDAAGLDAAATELDRVAEAAGAGSSVQQEALLTLARVRLYQERYAEAAAPLRRLVALGDYAAPEARRLLDYVTAQAGAPGAE